MGNANLQRKPESQFWPEFSAYILGAVSRWVGRSATTGKPPPSEPTRDIGLPSRSVCPWGRNDLRPGAGDPASPGICSPPSQEGIYSELPSSGRVPPSSEAKGSAYERRAMGLFEKRLCAYPDGRWTWPVIIKGSRVPSVGAVGTARAPVAIRRLAAVDTDTAGHSWRLSAAPSAGLELKAGDKPNVVASLTLRMVLLLYIQK